MGALLARGTGVCGSPIGAWEPYWRVVLFVGAAWVALWPPVLPGPLGWAGDFPEALPAWGGVGVPKKSCPMDVGGVVEFSGSTPRELGRCVGRCVGVPKKSPARPKPCAREGCVFFFNKPPAQ